MVATSIPRRDTSRRQQLAHLLLNRWPEEWANRYASRGYVAHDATIRRVISSPEPFFWRELAPYIRDDLSARRIMDEATEFNLKEGFTLSLQTLDGQTMLFSLGGQHLAVNPDARGVLTLVAHYAISRAIMLNPESNANASAAVVLSSREREALQWASEGKGDWEIGEVMNISEHGADKHMRSVRAKLGVSNRTQAVAEGIRRGLIA
jgi:LuxR family quorum sensing-dependent transcriptional regulator